MERKCMTCRYCHQRKSVYICANFESDRQFTQSDYVCDFWEPWMPKEDL